MQHRALDAFDYARELLFISSRLSPRGGKPGEVINLLPKEKRKALKDLTSDMLANRRIPRWDMCGPSWGSATEDLAEELREQVRRAGHVF